jgi:transcriptional regulator with PAS, ATPase and Fis domain
MNENSKNKLNEAGNLLDSIPHDLLFRFLDNPHESLVIVDVEGKIVFMSRSYKKAGVKSIRDAIGKNIADVIPRSKMHRVLQTGRAEIDQAVVISGKQRVIARIPILKDGKVIGGFGKVIFWHTERVNELYNLVNDLKGKIKHYENELVHIYTSRYSFDNIIGESTTIRKSKKLALKAAEMDSPILITGESGTGKELFAHAIHHASMRKEYPFVRVNCSSIPAELIESELFGYEPGAFTGASAKGKMGKFELAAKGTIFLDEIGDMPLNSQVKLLRVIQEKEIEKIGGPPKKIDFRVITATNRELEKMVRNGEFRLDLFYRMNVVNINLPSLREMKEDIPSLVYHLIKEIRKDMPKVVNSVSNDALTVIKDSLWPGNVRQLRNTIERAMINCTGNRIELEDLPRTLVQELIAPKLTKNSSLSLKEQMAKAEQVIIANTLKMASNNRTKTAEMLKIHRTGLHKKLKKYGIVDK